MMGLGQAHTALEAQLGARWWGPLGGLGPKKRKGLGRGAGLQKEQSWWEQTHRGPPGGPGAALMHPGPRFCISTTRILILIKIAIDGWGN